jgi:hypothetical protein
MRKKTQEKKEALNKVYQPKQSKSRSVAEGCLLLAPPPPPHCKQQTKALC